MSNTTNMIMVGLAAVAASACGSDSPRTAKNTAEPLPSSISSQSNTELTQTVALPRTAVLPDAPLEDNADPAQGRAETPKQRFARAKKLIRDGVYDEAIVILDDLSEISPNTDAVRLEWGRAMIAKEQYDEALPVVMEIVKRRPSSYRWNTVGRAFLGMGDYDDAITAFEAAVEENPKNSYAWNNLGLAKIRLGKYSDAVDALTKAVERPGAASYMWNNLGMARERVGLLAEARQAYRKAVELGSAKSEQHLERLKGVTDLRIPAVDGQDEDVASIDESPPGENRPPAMAPNQP